MTAASAAYWAAQSLRQLLTGQLTWLSRSAGNVIADVKGITNRGAAELIPRARLGRWRPISVRAVARHTCETVPARKSSAERAWGLVDHVAEQQAIRDVIIGPADPAAGSPPQADR